jgi:hypothetical protein
MISLLSLSCYIVLLVKMSVTRYLYVAYYFLRNVELSYSGCRRLNEGAQNQTH